MAGLRRLRNAGSAGGHGRRRACELSSTLRLQYFAQVETVRGAANEDSPLVRSKQDAGLGVSLIWGVWHSAESGIE